MERPTSLSHRLSFHPTAAKLISFNKFETDMILRLLVRICEFSPWLRKRVWHRWYQYLAGYQMEKWRFMNYGYVSLDDHAAVLDLESEDEPDRLSIQLYHHVVGERVLVHQDVLEVGCGRGGGASFVSRYHHPRQMTALDYSQKAIQFCQKTSGTQVLNFVHGKAESLPFEDEQFDTVLNVESSHCYGSMKAFLAEVKRVLRPGGHFLYADFRVSGAVELLDSELKESGMSIVERTDITANVLESMHRDNDRKLELIGEWGSGRLDGTLRQFAGVEGSEIHEGFRNGDIVYLHYRLQKLA